MFSNKYVAIKVLNGASTEDVLAGRTLEQEAQARLSQPSPYSLHCLVRKSDFVMQGKGSAGRHLCYVMDACGATVDALQRMQGRFPLPTAKHILRHILRGIAHVHHCGVIHTDIKPDNILTSAVLSTEEVNEILISDPPRRHPTEISIDGEVQVAVSQPLPVSLLDILTSRRFVLSDFGAGESHSPTQWND